MTVDALDWTKFTDSNEIPDWISNAYSASYQGPPEDTTDTETAAESIPAPTVTPALLQSHYRLGSHRPAGESRVAVCPPDDPSGAGEGARVRRPGRRCRGDAGQPLPGRRQCRRGHLAALAGRRALHATGISTLPGA